jgi:hypothetical protein
MRLCVYVRRAYAFVGVRGRVLLSRHVFVAVVRTRAGMYAVWRLVQGHAPFRIRACVQCVRACARVLAPLRVGAHTCGYGSVLVHACARNNLYASARILCVLLRSVGRVHECARTHARMRACMCVYVHA